MGSAGLLGVGDRCLGEGSFGYCCSGFGGGFVKILKEGSTEVGNGSGRVDGDVGEAREVLAAVGECGKMADGGVGQEDKRNSLALDLSARVWLVAVGRRQTRQMGCDV